MGLIWLKVGFLRFTVIQDTNVILGLKLLTTGANLQNGVMCTGKESKSGLKLGRMETDVATHTCKLFLRKKP